MTATFEGSDSYFSSEAGTSFVVSETTAPASVVVPAQPPASTGSIASSVASTPMQSVLPLPSEAQQPPTSAMPTTTYLAVAVAVII